MAAYAALVSLTHIIEQLEHHPRPPISLHKNQVEFLTKNITFLQEFLEGITPIGKYEEDGVESRILDAANAAEDVIESYIVDRILAGSTSEGDQVEFDRRLQNVIEDMNLIKNEVVETKEKMRAQLQPQSKSITSSSGQAQSISMQRKSTSSSGAQKLPSIMTVVVGIQQFRETVSSLTTRQKKNTTMVGFGDALIEILDKLTGRQHIQTAESPFKTEPYLHTMQPFLQIIPIVGMGGIGKTTLARNVFTHPSITVHFDILVWVTISQEYEARNILSEILSQVEPDHGNSSEMDEEKIGYLLQKSLFNRRYLIVIDDLCSIEVWRKMKYSFPLNNNDSRIIVTTRLSNLARELSHSYALHMKFLDMDKSWDLFSKIVFTKGDYHPEMVEIGKKIVGKCGGLPLSIVVVGGFLAKSGYKREHWEHIEKNLNSFVNSHNDEQCLNMLRSSYNQLAVHLKPCLLYMGVFEEDTEICISKLVKLWVAEGFVKPISGKDLEEVAEEYLNDLADRNLIFIVENRRKYVKIHDLLRDFCLRQAEAERFYVVVTRHSITIPHNQRRFIVSEPSLGKGVLDALQSMPRARSIISFDRGIQPSHDHRLLRISGGYDHKLFIDEYYQEKKFQLVNLRHLFASSRRVSEFATSLHLLWSLQTLIIKGDCDYDFTAPAEIWKMPQLRNVQVQGYLYLPDPPGQDDVVLENLQTLALVKNFKWGEEAVKRIPNLKKLGLEYVGNEIEESCLNNLNCLHKLKSLKCRYRLYPEHDGINFLQKLSFPRSLEKLSLNADLYVHWEDMLENIGSLPLLQKLELCSGFFTTHAWETFEGQFPSLKFLKLDGCVGLEHWNSESSHFPRLEHLVLQGLHYLHEIPYGFGEIPTLQSIELYHCSKSAVISCQRIQEFHMDREVLRVRAEVPSSYYKVLKHLASSNFEVISM